MSKLPVLTGDKLVAALAKAGFELIRQRGSHVYLKHPDGRSTVVPVHKGQTIGRGLLGSILRDVEINREDLLNLL